MSLARLALFVAALAVYAAWANVAAAQTRRAAPFTITAPDAASPRDRYGPVVLAVIDQRRAFPTGGSWCPDMMSEDEICLGADLVEGPAEIVAYLSPRPAGWRDPGPRPRVRFIGGHAVRRVAAGRRLAILEYTDGGYLWRSWSTPVDRGWACIDPQVMTAFRVQTRVRFRRRGSEEHCFRLSQLR